MALHQVATINAACLALQALEAKGAPTQNIRTSLDLATAGIEKALEMLPNGTAPGGHGKIELPDRHFDDAMIALSQARGVTDLLILAAGQPADDDSLELTGAPTGTLIQSLYAIRSEIERAGELLIAGKPLREVSHG